VSVVCAYYRHTFCASVISLITDALWPRRICDVPERASVICFFYIVSWGSLDEELDVDLSDLQPSGLLEQGVILSNPSQHLINRLDRFLCRGKTLFLKSPFGLFIYNDINS